MKSSLPLLDPIKIKSRINYKIKETGENEEIERIVESSPPLLTQIEPYQSLVFTHTPARSMLNGAGEEEVNHSDDLLDDRAGLKRSPR